MPLTFKTKCFETFMGIWASTVTLRPYDTMILSLTHWNLKKVFIFYLCYSAPSIALLSVFISDSLTISL
jgi:hypothetical protein